MQQPGGYSSGSASPRYEAGYPPASPSSPHQRGSPDGGQRRRAAQYGGSLSPSPRSGTGGGGGGGLPPYQRPMQSPLSQAGGVHGYPGETGSDAYEERDLGELAAANQAAQERSWGTHTALSEAAERTVGSVPGRYLRLASMPTIPQYESESYDGGYYLEAPTAYDPPPQFDALPDAPSPSAAGDVLPNFPTWSQTWFGGHASSDGHDYTAVSPDSGQSGWDSETLAHNRALLGARAHGPVAYGRAGPDAPMARHVKEGRIRMPQKESGPEISHKDRGKTGDDDQSKGEDEGDDGPLPIGSVDPRGKLVLPGPKLRTTVRCFQCLVSMAGASCGILGYILIRPSKKAPASGQYPSFILYGVSALSTILCLWLFVLRPMCTNPLRKVQGGAAGAGTGGMVIPVLSGGSGGKGKPKKLKMGKRQPAGLTVNLILDPTLLGQGRHHDDTDSDTDGDENDTRDYLPGEERRRKRRRRRRRAHPLGVLGNVKAQAAWKILRTQLKVTTIWDVLLCLAWGAAAICAVTVGKSCPPGEFKGWCNAYNGAIACAFIAMVTFMVAIYVDVRDLKASIRPPKTTT